MNRLPRLLPYLLVPATCLLWLGVSGIQLNGDDYQYLHSLAPMHSVGDALRPWTEHDANPHYFRPLANTTMVADFLLFGWSGSAFHLTNLLFHVVASLLVYPVARRVFRISQSQALIAALLFAILASHEYNLVVDTARADELVTIFGLLAMLALESWSGSRQASSLTLATLCYSLALTSKELAFFLLPVFAWQVIRAQGIHLLPVVRALWPLALVSIAFLIYHEHFTLTTLGSNDVVQGASVGSVLKNAAFSLAYLFLPLEQETALRMMHDHVLLVALALVAIGLLWLAVRTLGSSERKQLMLPLLFLFVTGISSWLVFERWRLYLPSVGAVIVLVMFGSALLRRSYGKILVAVLACAFIGYHVNRALSAQRDWQRSTAMMHTMKNDLRVLLSNRPSRQMRIMLVTVPAKLGSAGVMVLGWEALAQQAEAERLNAPGLALGAVDTSTVNVDGAIQVYALNTRNAFAGLRVQQTGASRFIVSAPGSAGLRLIPAGAGFAAARQELNLSAGDTLTNIVVNSYQRNPSIEAIEFSLLDSTVTPVIFDGKHLTFAR